ncbi:MAG: type II toxin-antitoxin system PemK/MazF family toxin [Clostridia bacterium]|nr:type II toxin-antitoxin system PemK/MazF family toxin [Clostridia bacterium]
MPQKTHKNSISNFIQIASSNNKIKSLNELNSTDEFQYDDLKEYIYNQLSEESVNYNNYKIGDIVFVQKYKYKNGSPGNNHMFLIVDSKEHKKSLTYFGMLISSKIEKISFKSNKYIKKDNQNNLKKNSIIKTDAIYKIFTKNILLKVGNIDKTKVDIYKNHLINNN